MIEFIKIGNLILNGEAHSQTGPFGTQLKASEYVEEGYPVINVKNIGYGEIRKTGLEFITEEKTKELHSHLLINKDIVFGRKGAVERHAFITKEEEGWVQGSDCIRLRFLSDKINPLFISYFFRTERHKKWMINLGSFGATMGSLNQEIISKIEIPFIPKRTQDKIASILSAYDELIENNQKRIKLLEEMAEEIYKEWFVRMRFPGYQEAIFRDKEGKVVPHGTEGALPEGWEIGPLGKIVEVKKGKNITKNSVIKGRVPVVAGGLNPAYYHNMANTSSPTVTVSASGANAGYVNLYYEDIWASDCSYIDLKTTDQLFFFYLTLKTRQKEVFHLQKGSAQPHVYPKDLMGLKLLIPSVHWRENLEKVIAPFFEKIKILKTKNKILQQTRDLLLPRLISGKLDVEKLGIELEEIS